MAPAKQLAATPIPLRFLADDEPPPIPLSYHEAAALQRQLDREYRAFLRGHRPAPQPSTTESAPHEQQH